MPAQRPRSSGGAKKPVVSSRVKKQTGSMKAPKPSPNRDYVRGEQGYDLSRQETAYKKALVKDYADRVLRDKTGPKPKWSDFSKSGRMPRRSSGGRG